MKPSGIYEKIRKIVAKIPKRKVLTYGDVARLALIRDSRIVGWALRGNADPKIPCYRVVKQAGVLAVNYSLGGWQEQKRRLLSDGIVFARQKQLDIKKYRWQV